MRQGQMTTGTEKHGRPPKGARARVLTADPWSGQPSSHVLGTSRRRAQHCPAGSSPTGRNKEKPRVTPSDNCGHRPAGSPFSTAAAFWHRTQPRAGSSSRQGRGPRHGPGPQGAAAVLRATPRHQQSLVGGAKNGMKPRCTRVLLGQRWLSLGIRRLGTRGPGLAGQHPRWAGVRAAGWDHLGVHGIDRHLERPGRWQQQGTALLPSLGAGLQSKVSHIPNAGGQDRSLLRVPVTHTTAPAQKLASSQRRDRKKPPPDSQQQGGEGLPQFHGPPAPQEPAVARLGDIRQTRPEPCASHASDLPSGTDDIPLNLCFGESERALVCNWTASREREHTA